jgi:MazG family protein
MKEHIMSGEKFQKLVDILDGLRGRNGCPWDKEQDEKSITHYFLEEVYEAVEAILSGEIDSIVEELGDVMMEIVFLAQIYKEKKKFSITDVLTGINRKMKERHPHVFGRKKVHSSQQVIRDWNINKSLEKKRGSVFDGLVGIAPALVTAYQMGQRVSNYGFDWKGPLEALEKIKEEISELETAMKKGEAVDVESELGDVLFATANVSRLSGINPELALRRTNKTFMHRFKKVEEKIIKQGKRLEESTPDEMNEIWEEVKKD